MKRPDIEAIKKRCEKATPGPWQGNHYMELFEGKYFQIDAEYDAVATTAHCYAKEVKENIQFIAHARTDIPALLAYIEKLEKELGDDEPDEEAKYYQDLLGY